MDKLILSEYGTAGKIYALGVCGSDRFRELTENLLVNYGVIHYQMAKFHSLSEGFGYFIIDIDKFRKALEDYFHYIFWTEKKVQLDDEKTLAKAAAIEYINNIERENFMQYCKTDLTDYTYANKYGQS